MSTYRSNQYRMHSPGFSRRDAVRGHFNSDVEIEYVDSDDGIDYIDWDAHKDEGWPKDVDLTYRVIDGKYVRFRDGVAYGIMPMPK